MNWQKNGTTIVLVAVIALMGAEILYLVYQNRQLRGMLDDPSRFFDKTLQAGEMVPAIRAEDVNGAEISLTYAANGPFTMALWFSPTCTSCEDNFEFWNEVERRRVPDRLRVMGFCACNAGEGQDAVAAHSLGYPVLAATEPSIVDLYKGNLLPQTILIDPSGAILQVWPGALLERQKNEIFSMLASVKTIKPEGGE